MLMIDHKCMYMVTYVLLDTIVSDTMIIRMILYFNILLSNTTVDVHLSIFPGTSFLQVLEGYRPPYQLQHSD